MKGKESEEKSVDNIYRAIFENSIDAILITTPDGGIQSANPAACKMFRCTEDEIIRNGRSGVLDLTDERIAGMLKERELTGKIAGELRYKRSDGSIFPADFTSTEFKDASGSTRTVTIIRDITVLKGAEESIRRSEEKFRLSFMTSKDVIYLATLEEGLIIEVNDAFQSIFGYTRDETIGKTSLQLNLYADPEDRKKLVGILKKNGSVKDLELNGRKKGGEKIVVSLSVGIFSLDGVSHILGIIRDITEHKKSEEKLKRSEADYRNLFENSLMAISQAIPGKGFIRINDAYVKLYGYPDSETMLNEISENTIKLYSNPADRDKVIKLLDRNGFMPPTEFELNKWNGDKFWALVSAKQIKDNDGKILYLQAEHIDITDRKRVQEELRRSEEKYRLLSEQSGVGVGLYSPEGKIMYFNQRALKNLGGKLEDYLDKSLIDVFGKKTGLKYIKRIKEGIRLNKTLIYEDYLESPSGKYWFSSSHSIVHNSLGETVGIQVVSLDITERKLFESQLIQSTSELRELTRHLVEIREEERTAIARDLHDDLGQRLTALNMDISWLKSRIGVQSRNVENKLNQMVKMMNDTIESVQKISYGLRPSILDDLGLIPAIEWHVSDFHKSSGISCNFNCAPNDISVDSRVSLVVFRVIQEALTNITRHSGATKVSIKLSMTEGILEILIKDNGSGISQEKIDCIKSYGLIGMRERVRVVNGEISITGRQGEGTRVDVRIPVEDLPPSRPSPRGE